MLRMFGHLKINRAVATRYDQLASSLLSMVRLATARYWLKFVHAAWLRWPIDRNWLSQSTMVKFYFRR